MGWLDEMFQKGQNRRAVGRILMMLTMISIGYGNVPKGKKDCQKGQKVVLRCCDFNRIRKCAKREKRLPKGTKGSAAVLRGSDKEGEKTHKRLHRLPKGQEDLNSL